LLLHLDNNSAKFESLLMQMLAKRDQWLPRLYRDDALDLQMLQNTAADIVCQHLVHLQNLATGHFEQSFFALLAHSTEQKLANIQTLPSADIADFANWKLLADLCLTAAGDWRKSLNKKQGFPPETKQQKDDLLKIIQSLSANDELKNALQELRILPDADFSEAQVTTLKTIATVLKIATAQLSME